MIKDPYKSTLCWPPNDKRKSEDVRVGRQGGEGASSRPAPDSHTSPGGIGKTPRQQGVVHSLPNPFPWTLLLVGVLVERPHVYP